MADDLAPVGVRTAGGKLHVRAPGILGPDTRCGRRFSRLQRQQLATVAVADVPPAERCASCFRGSGVPG